MIKIIEYINNNISNAFCDTYFKELKRDPLNARIRLGNDQLIIKTLEIIQTKHHNKYNIAYPIISYINFLRSANNRNTLKEEFKKCTFDEPKFAMIFEHPFNTTHAENNVYIKNTMEQYIHQREYKLRGPLSINLLLLTKMIFFSKRNNIHIKEKEIDEIYTLISHTLNSDVIPALLTRVASLLYAVTIVTNNWYKCAQILQDIEKKQEYPIDAHSYSKITRMWGSIQQASNKHDLQLNVRQHIINSIQKMAIAIGSDYVLNQFWHSKYYQPPFSIYHEIITAFANMVFLDDKRGYFPYKQANFIQNVLDLLASFNNLNEEMVYVDIF